MLNRLIILIIGIAFIGCNNLYSQTNERDSLGELVYEKFLELNPRKINYPFCNRLIKRASRMCNNDSLILPLYHRMFGKDFSIDINSTTCKELLKEEYGFIGKDVLDFGDVVPDEVLCFEEYTVKYAQDKYGIAFFKNRKKEADSLDAIGMGFVVAQPNNSCDSIPNQLKKKMKSAKKLFKDKEFLRWVVFKVSESGKISNVTYSMRYWDGFVLIKDNKYEKKVLKIMAGMPDWSPATLRGKPVSSEITFVINENWR